MPSNVSPAEDLLPAYAGPGHNNPPSEAEIVRQRLDLYTDEAATYERLASREIPDVIESDEEAGKLSDYVAAVKVLDGQISAVKGRWGGAGANAFFILHNAWQEKHKVVVTALDKFHASLTETEKDNVQVDQQAGDFMNSLINKLGNVQG